MTVRNPLESDLFEIVDKYVERVAEDPSTPPLTATDLATLASDHLARDVSRGTISNYLDRWEDQCIAIVGRDPLRFVRYTPEVYTVGITDLKKKHRKPYGQSKTKKEN